VGLPAASAILLGASGTDRSQQTQAAKDSRAHERDQL
jgi:hypothetical protein